MYKISFFKKKNDPFFFAVTPDQTGSVLPSAGEWQHWFTQEAHPEQAVEGCALAKFEVGFRKDGYCVFPRNGSMQPDYATPAGP
jgi:hypothetical protein